MKSILCAALLAACVIPTVHAEVIPSAGYRDARVKNVAYDGNDVVKLLGRYGYSTVIEFAPGETIDDIALGDTLAWEVAPSRNNLFVKPREDSASTNMTVVTDKHIYHFMLQALAHRSKAPADAFFAVRFTYPAEESAKRAAALDADRAKLVLNGALPKPSNYNYWSCGDLQLRPTEAFDDGRFTYLRFPGAQEVPAVFVINSDNTESLVNGQMRGDLYVVFAVARKFILRKGNSASCVENRSFNWYGVGTPNGTTSPKVERTIKAASKPAPPVQTLPSSPNDQPAQQLRSQMAMPLESIPSAPQAPVALPSPPVTTPELQVPAASLAPVKSTRLPSTLPASLVANAFSTLNSHKD